MLSVGRKVKVWQETVNGGMQLVGRGYIEVMGMGKLVINDGLSHVQKFALRHVILEEDGDGSNELRSGTCPKPQGASDVKVYHKQKAHFHSGGNYRTESYLQRARA